LSPHSLAAGWAVRPRMAVAEGDVAIAVPNWRSQLFQLLE
jgi:hypothetical protein